MKLADFSPEAQELLKKASFLDLKMLGAEANGIKDREQINELGADPGEAIRQAFEFYRLDISIEIDDALEFVEETVEAARTIAGHEMSNDHADPEYRSMWSVLTAALDVLRQYRSHDAKAREYLRAAYLKQRDG